MFHKHASQLISSLTEGTYGSVWGLFRVFEAREQLGGVVELNCQ